MKIMKTWWLQCLFLLILLPLQVKPDINFSLSTFYTVVAPDNPPDKITYLALGDSYTLGEGVKEFERWPVQLAEAISAKGLAVSPPVIIARTGWTTDELMVELDRRNIADTFDLVSLLIGVNNQYSGRSAAQFRTELVQLITKAVELAGGKSSQVLLISIPDWGVTPFAMGRDRARIAREIDEFNTIVRQEADARNIKFFDITPISRLAKDDLNLLAADRLHPSAKMYALWVQLMLDDVLKGLQTHE